ncbi:MAG: Flp1 family type IVb pilin [Lachnospiraceae bacterium]
MKNKIKNKLTIAKLSLLTRIYKFNDNNKGMGVIEIVLIILVLVGLVVIFRSHITAIINSVFSKVTKQINTF